MDPNVPGQAYDPRFLNPRARTPPDNDLWFQRQLLERQLEQAAMPRRSHRSGGGGGGSRSRHRRKSSYSDEDSLSGSGEDDDFDLRSAEAAEVARLREELRAARRRLDAGERRERALRRSMRETGLAPLPSNGQDGEPHTRAPPGFGMGLQGGGGLGLGGGGASRMPIGTGGLLDKVLLESGMLATEEGRREVAELLARASAQPGAEPPGVRAPLPPPPAMRQRQQREHERRNERQPPPADGADEPAAFSSALPSHPLRDISDGAARQTAVHLSGMHFNAPPVALPGFSNLSATPLGSLPAAQPMNGPSVGRGGSAAQDGSGVPLGTAPPLAASQQRPPAMHAAQNGLPTEHSGAGGGRMPFSMHASESFRFTSGDVDSTLDALVTSLLREEVPALIKASLREAVAPMLKSTERGGGKGTSALDGGVYGQIAQVIVTSLVSSEAEAVVGEAIRAVAEGFVQRRGAERVFESMVEDILHDELTPLAAEARVAVVTDELLHVAMEPICREVAVSVLHEARGAAARMREAQERRMVADVASDGLFERLCLQRLLQHVATSGEVLLLQRQAAQLLDELVAEGLARRALSVGQEHSQLQSSAVFSAAHQRIAYGALVDEMLAQLRVLAASGLEAGVPPIAPETDTSEDDEEEEGGAAAVS
jgi:hypothetical protein